MSLGRMRFSGEVVEAFVEGEWMPFSQLILYCLTEESNGVNVDWALFAKEHGFRFYDEDGEKWLKRKINGEITHSFSLSNSDTL